MITHLKLKETLKQVHPCSFLEECETCLARIRQFPGFISVQIPNQDGIPGDADELLDSAGKIKVRKL